MSSSKKTDSGGNQNQRVSMLQQQLQQLVNDPLSNVNHYHMQQQYQQILQQNSHHLTGSNGQLMASPMAANNMSYDQSNNNFPLSYQQNFMHYLQFQQQQQQQIDPNQSQQQQQVYQNSIAQVNSQQSQLQQLQQHLQQPILMQYVQQNQPNTNTQFLAPIVPQVSPQLANAQQQPQHTPIVATTSVNRGQRKRQRRSDHALPGDEGDSELKDMAHKLYEIPFEELAAEVRQVENSNSRISSPNTGKTLKEEELTRERKRQVFAMVCLMKSCQESPNAVVPRSRIYSRYVTFCSNNGVAPLSAASFGKLVKILYPLITTRRLGMRGQSKYHYCGIRFLGDESPTDSPVGQTPIDSPFATPRTGNSGTNSPMSIVSRTSSIANNNQSFIGASHSSTPATLDSDIRHFITPNLKFRANLIHDLQIHSQQLEISPNNNNNNRNNNNSINNEFLSLELPSLQMYVPANTDKDTVITLDSLYKAHCNSVFESLRYMQLTKLFNHVTSFAFLLTLPVYKLYISEEIRPWVLECDIKTYQLVIKMLSKLAFQKIPSYILPQLQFIAKNLTEKYQSSLKKLPIEFVKLKLKPVETFARLISRLLNVSNSSISGTKILMNPDERIKVLNDWQKCDFKDIVDKGIPCTDPLYIDRIMSICTKDVPNLLSYDYLSDLNNENLSNDAKDDEIHFLILQKWASFLVDLPIEFPTLSPRMFLLCLSSLLTTTLREMTLLAGESFGAWWILRCWVDDWMGWCAELGGFLEIGSIAQQRDNTKNTHLRNIKTGVLAPDVLSETQLTTNTGPVTDTTVTSPYMKKDLLEMHEQGPDEIDLFNI